MTIGRNRKYKSGSIWGFWRWTDIESNHIVRLHIIKTPWFAIDMHWLLKADPEPYLHDHPVTFLSIILNGWYKEERAKNAVDWKLQTHRWFNFIKATPQDRHSIIEVGPNTVTLCFMGPKIREWGFHKGNQWIYWKDYYSGNH